MISTKFLGETANVQFWVAQLLLELSRWSSKHPSSDLQAVVLFDEADMYLPAIGKPASKQPMERAAEAGSLGGTRRDASHPEPRRLGLQVS